MRRQPDVVWNSGNRPEQRRGKAEIKSLGRFAEPAIKFAIGQTNDLSSRDRPKEVLASVRSN